MGKLTAKSRKALPTKDFAGKGRSYPIEDRGHAKAAIARAKEYRPSDEAAIVRKAEAKLQSVGKEFNQADKGSGILKKRKKQPQKDGLREYAKNAGKGML